MYKDITKIPELTISARLHKALDGHDMRIEYINKKNVLETIRNIESINSSMELDSGQTIAHVKGIIDGICFDAKIHVCGPVRVIFRNEVFCAASKMPADLLRAYHKGLSPKNVAEADGNSYASPYFCDQSNCFDKHLRLTDENDNVIADRHREIDAPENKSAQSYFNMLLEDVIRLKETLKS